MDVFCMVPKRLQDILIDYVAQNLTDICMVQNNEFGSQNLVFRDENSFIDLNISDKFLKRLDEAEELDDLVLTLFNPEIIKLKHVTIYNSSKITFHGLKILKKHSLSSLNLWALTNISINEIFSCFSEWTFNNLRTLSLHGSIFTTQTHSVQKEVNKYKINVGKSDKLSKFFVKSSTNINFEQSCTFIAKPVVEDFSVKKYIKTPVVYIGFCKLKSLTELNLSETDLETHVLKYICKELKCLKLLDVSSCLNIDSIECIKELKYTLKCLKLYNLPIFIHKETKDVLLSLKNLFFLDISKTKSRSDPLNDLIESHSIVSELLKDSNFVPKIKAIDISGHTEVTESDIQYFLQNHEPLSFLGLVSILNVKETTLKFHPDCLVTGVSTLDQIKQSLKFYQRRKEYIPKLLYEIFSSASEFNLPQPDIIELTLLVMECNKCVAPIQLAGTACLYNLTKGGMGESINPKILKKVVQATLLAMENFPRYPQLQKNALLTLCCDHILQSIDFDHFWCARLVLDCLLTFNDAATDRMAVAICSILAAKISTSETALLGASTAYMVKLLRIVQKKIDAGMVDFTLKFTLSALWNLTDESPATCEVFLSEHGLPLYLKLLNTFPKDITVETKVLGLLNNIAEVGRLRHTLIHSDLILQLRNLLKSKQVEVSYFAAGIIAHLMCVGVECWKDCNVVSRETLLEELGFAVIGWQEPREEMVAYRSFQPFIPLLMALDKPQVQLWSVWALLHVITKNEAKYHPMLIREGVDNTLKQLVELPETDERVCQLATSVLNIEPKLY